MEPLSQAQRLVYGLVVVAIAALAMPIGEWLINDFDYRTQNVVRLLLFFLAAICAIAALAIHQFLRLKR